jgi:hypothetical protein
MKIQEIILSENTISVGDGFGIELNDVLIETAVVGFMPDGVIVESDEEVFKYFKNNGLLDTKMIFTESRMAEVDRIFQDLIRGHRGITDVLNNPTTAEEKYVSDKLEDMIDEIVMDYDLNPEIDQEKILDVLTDKIASEFSTEYEDDIKPPIVSEAEYRGRKVSLGKPTRGDVKKFKVYVKGPKGNVVKVNFGDPNMRIKKSNPARRKSFRARHNCASPGPRWKARYWSCRKW